MTNQQFPAGATIHLAATVRSKPTPTDPEGVVVVDAVTWSADQGTISVDPTNPELATLVNVPIGTVTVTATTSNGIADVLFYDVFDATPGSITVAAS